MDRNYTRMQCVRSSNPQNSSCVATYPQSYKPSKKDEQNTAGEVRIFSYGLLHIDTQVLADQQTLDAIKRTCQEQ